MRQTLAYLGFPSMPGLCKTILSNSSGDDWVVNLFRRVKMLFEALEDEEPAVMYLAALGADEFVWVDRSASSLPSDFGTIIVAPAFGNLYSTACEVLDHEPRYVHTD